MDMEELLKKQKEFEDEQGARKALLGSLEAVANVPTAYEIRKGRTIGQPFKFTGGESPSSPLELAQAELAGQAKLADLEEAKQKQAVQAAAADPESQLAKSLRLFYKAKGIDVPGGLGAGEMARHYGTPKEILENESKLSKEQQLIADRAEAQKGLIQARAQYAPKKVSSGAALKPEMSEQDKLSKLNASDKARFDNVLMTSKAIDGMIGALAQGQSRYSLLGDNDYTANLTRATEALGRMQSGGAISKDEEARFSKMLRSLGDDPAMQLKKLSQLKDEMKSRYQTLGFDPEKSPVFATPKPQAQPPQPAQAAPSRVPDQAALQAELKRRGLIK